MRVEAKVSRIHCGRSHIGLSDSDSTVLAHVLTLLNQRYDYGLDLFLLSIDEGITGYRDDSLEVSRVHGVVSGQTRVTKLKYPRR